MTIVKDFIGSIHNKWMEDNIRKGFGKTLDSDYTYIARVLQVTDVDKDDATSFTSADKFLARRFGSVPVPDYFIRCRILEEDNASERLLGLSGKERKNMQALINPDAALPDPCDWFKPHATAAILRHPKYFPLGNNIKKPYIGDLVKVSRALGAQPADQIVGSYIGFLIQSPPMDLPPPEAGGGGFGGNKPRKERKWPEGWNPPVRYAGAKLARIAKQAANAINNSGTKKSATDGGDHAVSPLTGLPIVEDRAQAGAGRDNLSNTWVTPVLSDSRLPTEFVMPPENSPNEPRTTNFPGIPPSWYDINNVEFQKLQEFIHFVSDGYAGMPNGNLRRFLINKILETDYGFPPPPMTQFGKKPEWWKLWWTGKNRSDRAPTDFKYRSYVTKGGSTGYAGKIRFGFGAFKVGDAGEPGKPTDSSNLYFPKEKKIKLGIKYAGANGIGDPVCEMYATMMFIKLNFGSPYQFYRMGGAAKLIAQNKGEKKKCQEVVDHAKSGFGRYPEKIRDYKIDYSIMPKTSQYRFGMCDRFPPKGEM